MYSSPLSSADKEECGLAAGDEYTISFTITSTVSGSITVNGNVVEIIQGETEVNVKSTTTIEEDASYWADYGYKDENDQEVGEWITTTAATLRVQFGADPDSFLGAATVSISGLTFAPYVLEGDEMVYTVDLAAITSPMTFAAETDAPEDGNLYYWNDQYWTGSNVTMTNYSYNTTTSSYDVGYTITGECWFGLQLFLRLPREVGLAALSSITTNITLTSDTAGDITINGEVVTLAVGENTFEIKSTTDQYGTALSFQTGVEATSSMLSSTGAAFSISALSFSYIYVEPEPEEELEEGTVAMTSGGSEAAVYAAADGIMHYYINSDIYLTDAYYYPDQGKYVITTQHTDWWNWWDLQLWLQYPAEDHLISGTSFVVKMTIESTVAGDITVNGVETSLVVGTNTIEITSSYTAYTDGKCDVCIMAGHDAVGGTSQTILPDGTFIIYDISVEAVAS